MNGREGGGEKGEGREKKFLKRRREKKIFVFENFFEVFDRLVGCTVSVQYLNSSRLSHTVLSIVQYYTVLYSISTKSLNAKPCYI